MVVLASPAVHSNLVVVEDAAAVDLLELAVHLLAVELAPVGSPLTGLDGRISKIGYDLMNRCKEEDIFKHLSRSKKLKKFKINRISYLLCDDASFVFVAGGPSPSSAIKLRYSSSIFA